MHHLDGLNERQMEAVHHVDGPLLIVAGAGAGKTKTITHRIANLLSKGVPPNQLLAVTFTNKAAREMLERIQKLTKTTFGGPFVSTFHTLGVRILREFADEADVSRNFVIWDRDDSIKTIKNILKERGLGEQYNPRAVLSVISRQKGDGVELSSFSPNIRNPLEKAVEEVWPHYEKALAAQSALDFDDLVLKPLQLLRNRPDVLSKLRDRWTHITIDEYQDTNMVQYELMKLLAGEKRNICAVGDIDQNIYSWRGADIAHLLSFEKSFPGTKVVLLEKNYRSTQTILTAANAVIAKNMRRFEKNLYTDNPTGDAIRLFGAPDEQIEAQFVVQGARELIASGTPASEIAVLYRENFQSRALEEACIERGVPYRVLGTRFFERAEIKDMLSYLRAALNPKSRIDLSRATASPPRGIGKQTLEKIFSGQESALTTAARTKIAAFRALLLKMKEKIEKNPASSVMQFILTGSGLEQYFKNGTEEDRERLDNAYELVSLASKYDSLPPPAGIERLLEDAALMSEQDSLDATYSKEGQRDAISLMTVHASKGLEFDAVFVVGLEQGLFPWTREAENRDPEEERRLFYVALTRAKKNLYLSYAGSRLKYGSRELAIPSEFLEDIDARLYATTPNTLTRKRGLLDDWEDTIT